MIGQDKGNLGSDSKGQEEAGLGAFPLSLALFWVSPGQGTPTE